MLALHRVDMSSIADILYSSGLWRGGNYLANIQLFHGVNTLQMADLKFMRGHSIKAVVNRR